MDAKHTRYIFVTGGVVSSLGKGIATASLGKLLKARGLNVVLQKFDPYLNLDPGTMSPFQHGEVYVTDDGAETDLDLGHYERFIDRNLGRIHNVTSGQIYDAILNRERKGEYLGRTVQVVPHVTDEVKHRIKLTAIPRNDDDPPVDVVITEIGGTIGDIEGQPFLEALRQLRLELGEGRCLFLHLTLVPHITTAGEFKTKPTQHSVRELRGIGIQPDFLICRAERPLPEAEKKKIALFCNVAESHVIDAPDAESIYQIPLSFERQGLADRICERLGFEQTTPDLTAWRQMVDKLLHPKAEVRIAVVGKYTGLKDSYKSIIEAFIHAGVAHSVRVNLAWVSAEDVAADGAAVHLGKVDGLLIPGGFGERGIEGKIAAVRFARENRLPYLGICLGLQIAVVEFARSIMGLTKANSTEFDPDSPDPVIALLSEQEGVEDLGGTMRLGSYPCQLEKETIAQRLYKSEVIQERHRHRYEVNNNYRARFEGAGMVFSGLSPDGSLVEIIELADHPFFVGVQFHPELKSRPERAHPLFLGLVSAAIEHAGVDPEGVDPTRSAQQREEA